MRRHDRRPRHRPPAPTTAATAAVTACTDRRADGGGEKTLEIAYMSFAVANSYDAPMLAAARRAGDNNAQLTVFDGNMTRTSSRAAAGAITAGRYDGIITQPI